MGKELQSTLDALWASRVESLRFDPLDHRISFGLRVTKEGREYAYQLVFEGVASFYYVYEIGEGRLELSPRAPCGGYLELTTICYHRQGVGRIGITSRTEDWVQQWWASANFVIELWSRMLFIEASQIAVNDQVFEVGYPPTSRRPPIENA
jgi:hypothetical protein